MYITPGSGFCTSGTCLADMRRFSMRGEGEYFEGVQFRQEIVVRVRWPWIIAHAIFVACTIVLLAATIVSQRMSSLRGHGWKSSSLAVLHALDPVLQQTSGGISDESQLAEPAAAQHVRLRRTEALGWRLIAKNAFDEQADAVPLQQSEPVDGESYSLDSISKGHRNL
jgi:hypothetical protein